MYAVGTYIDLRDLTAAPPEPNEPERVETYAVGTKFSFRKIAGLLLVDVDEPSFYVSVATA